MLLVRPNLTELLLEVTNEEIEIIAKDVFTKTRMKGQTEYINIQNHVKFICLKKKIPRMPVIITEQNIIIHSKRGST